MVIEHVLGRGHWFRRSQLGTVAGTLAIALSLNGCGQDLSVGRAPDTVDHLTPSSIYLQSGDRAEAGLRLEMLRTAIKKLRAETESGWIGRQDDVTGYLTELTGGRYASNSAPNSVDSLVEKFMSSHGPDMFGITAEDLTLGEPLTTGGIPGATIRSTQHVRGVPVRDGTLIFTLADVDGTPQIEAVRGRVFAELNIETTPRISASGARSIAERVSDAKARSAPRLVVLPIGSGILAWAVPVTPIEDVNGLPAPGSLYYIDATSGDVHDVRPTNPTMVSPVPATGMPSTIGDYKLDSSDRPVRVTGKDTLGIKRTANGIRTANGVALVDTTVPSYNPKTGRGAIITYDGRGTKEGERPDRIFTQLGRSRTIDDPAAIGAHAFSRIVHDYYRSLGRNSFDGAGATMSSYVYFGGDEYCNAGFYGDKVMVYGPPCRTPRGDVEFVTLGTAGHEITHGVTSSTAGLIYSGQSGALNESFSDYFGNVISSVAKGRDDDSFDEDSCARLDAPDGFWCWLTPDKVLSDRYLLNGNSFDDYLRLLTPPLRLELLHPKRNSADHGGVHYNSAIWNNALWSIRKKIAAEDGTSMLKSKLVKRFDTVVFHTLTKELFGTAGFLDARAAIELTISRLPSNVTLMRVARQVFDSSRICRECAANHGLRGNPVEVDGATDMAPAINGKRIISIVESGGGTGSLWDVTLGKPGALLHENSWGTAAVGFAGKAVIAMQERDKSAVVRYASNGKKSMLESVGEDSLIAGLGGSKSGAAWSNPKRHTISFVNPAGKITRARLPGPKGDPVTAVSTGDGTVGIGTERGRIYLWKPGEKLRKLGETPETVRVTATYGKRVLTIDRTGRALLFNSSSKKPALLSTDASPFGATMNSRYAIWANHFGPLEGGVARSIAREYRNTDLYLHSYKSGKTDRKLLSQRGQQGFPALSGNRLAWQETGLGGDDIFTIKLR